MVRFSPKERLSAAKLNQLAEIADQALFLLRTGDGRRLLQLASSLASRIILARVAVVTSNGTSVIDPNVVPVPDVPDNVSYAVRAWGSEDEYTDLVPTYGRQATGTDVKIRPARVNDWCVIFRGVVDNEERGELWMLTEELDRVECEPPAAAKAQDAIVSLARVVVDVARREGLLGPTMLAAAPNTDGVRFDAASVEAAMNPEVQDVVMRLSETTCKRVFALPPNVKGVSVTAMQAVGTWTRALTVKVRASVFGQEVDVDFASAKTIVAPGSAAPVLLQIPDTDLPGVRALVIERSGAIETADVRLLVNSTIS